ncbi:MAG: glutamate-1-semialdehyde 2,1-aminomutase [Puniceicoccales bacterium]|nr:glutamate-1-semialdehyde 2,1-aminomutase [Puniceicoccales bacterium]
MVFGLEGGAGFATVADMTASEQLFARAQARIPGGVNSPVRAFRAVGRAPFYTASAEGCRLHTEEGTELVDYVLAWGPAIFGHNDPDIRTAVQNAAAAGLGFGTTHAAEVRMAEMLCENVPSVEKVRMTNSGTEATMSAIRLARGHTGRKKIIKFAGCFHGHVDALLVKAGSGALTFGHPDSAGVNPGAAADTLVLPYNDTAALDAAFAADAAAAGQAAPDIAAVILEPYPGNVGLLFPEAGFLAHLRERCTRNGTLLIFDEVMTGFRLSPQGTMGLHTVRPDLVCLGKIIGGGLPVGAFGGRADIMDKLAPLGPVYQSGTFCGHPVTLAAGLAALEKLRRKNPYPALERAGKRIATAVREAAQRKGVALQVHQCGSMFTLFFNANPVRNLADVLGSDGALFGSVFRYALDHGVFLPPSPFESAFISAAHDDAAITQTEEVLAAAIAAL